jgi:hypothetical protein
MRLKMSETVVVEFEACTAKMSYLKGETYNVDDDFAEYLLESDRAVDPDNPPTCGECLYVADSMRDLEEHDARAHVPQVEVVPVVVYPELDLSFDASDSKVQELSRYSERQLVWVGAQIGVTASDIKATDEHITRQEWIASILRAGASWPTDVPSFEVTETEGSVIQSTSTETTVLGDDDDGWIDVDLGDDD